MYTTQSTTYLRTDEMLARPRRVGLVPALEDHGGLHPGVVDVEAGRGDGGARGAGLGCRRWCLRGLRDR